MRDCRKVVGAGILGAIAVVLCPIVIFVLPSIVGLALGLVIEGAFQTFGVVHTALSVTAAAVTAWLLHLSFSSLILAWIVASMLSAAIGGLIGGVLGSLAATVILARMSKAKSGE